MPDRRRKVRTETLEPSYAAPPGEAWAVHRTAIDVALAYERAKVSAARAKERQSRLRRLASTSA